MALSRQKQHRHAATQLPAFAFSKTRARAARAVRFRACVLVRAGVFTIGEGEAMCHARLRGIRETSLKIRNCLRAQACVCTCRHQETKGNNCAQLCAIISTVACKHGIVDGAQALLLTHPTSRSERSTCSFAMLSKPVRVCACVRARACAFSCVCVQVCAGRCKA